MKYTFLFASIACAASLPLMAGEKLKVELLGPKDPVVISSKQLAEAAKYGDALKAYQAEMQEAKPDMESLRRLEEIVRKGRGLQQGVKFKIRLTNTSEKPITFIFGGDTTTNLLSVTGPGAVDCPYEGVMTADYRTGNELKLEAGKSIEFDLEGLKYGKREMSRWLISKAGEYKVRLTIREIFGKEHKSEPITLKVVSE